MRRLYLTEQKISSLSLDAFRRPRERYATNQVEEKVCDRLLQDSASAACFRFPLRGQCMSGTDNRSTSSRFVYVSIRRGNSKREIGCSHMRLASRGFSSRAQEARSSVRNIYEGNSRHLSIEERFGVHPRRSSEKINKSQRHKVRPRVCVDCLIRSARESGNKKSTWPIVREKLRKDSFAPRRAGRIKGILYWLSSSELLSGI